MDKVDALGVVQHLAVLGIGVGGAIGAFALGAHDLSMAILALCGGMLVPLRRVMGAGQQ